MADNQRVLKKNADDGFLAEDDPLAELARIVNFDLPVTPSRARISTPRREPEFNLEDELLKGLEQYEVEDDAPDLSAEAAFVAPNVDHDVRSAAAPVVRERSVEPSFGPVREEPAFYAPVEPVASPVSELPYVPSPAEPVFDAAPQPRLDPVGRSLFDLEEEIMQEFAAFDARRDGPAPQNAFEPTLSRREPEPPVYAPAPEVAPLQADDDLAADGWRLEDADFAQGDGALDVDVEPETQPLVEEQHTFVEAHWDDADYFPADTLVEALEDELHRSMADSLDTADVEDHVMEEPRVAQEHLAWSTPSVDPASFDDDAFWREPEADVSVVEEEAAPQPRSQPSTADAMALDRLLADVERYPVVTRSGWSRSTAFAPVGGNLAPAAREPAIPLVPQAETVAPPVPSPTAQASALASVAVQPAVEKAREDVVETSDEDDFPFFSDAELFDENAFELDLREIELDLLDVMDDAPPAKPVVAAPEPEPIDDSYPAVENIAKPALEAPVVIDAAPVRSDIGDLTSLPFDPSQISVEEDALEPLAEIDVPELPVVEQEQASTDPADYDLDIDADMAEFFAARPEPAAILPSRTPGRVESAAQLAAAPEKSTGDFDEFEKALEEDFRRSLSENRATVNLDRVPLTPVDVEETSDRRGRSRRVLVLAASVVGVALLGGAGVYAFIGGAGGLVATSGEPKIILADKEPMKVAPENPGGQKVPNQDKAVYDRVSGASTEEAKQPRLVTSNEEPVDVVQKTLMPENLPLDDEQDAMGTPTEDTTDARLLPEGATENVSTSEKVATGVAPRKVRTMIVRPDGSLVPREEIVADTAAATPDAPATASAQPVDVPERLPPDDISRTIEQASADPSVGQEQAARSVQAAATQTQPVADTQSAADNQTDAAETATGDPTDGAVITDQAAIAAASQVDVPAATDATETAPAEQPPAQPVETASAPANTPVPSNRPVEQPVNVIGSVTDQGRVTDDPAAAPQTANAEPQTQAPVAQTPTPAGSYVIQIASLPSQADAESSYKRLSTKFAGVIGGRGVDIKRAAIANKGTYYRVRIPVGSKQDAQELCARYKAAGGSCLVSK
ncbi:SPOR domain-containing protein [Rhizobium sp. G21]|uniref:SPOR domain-containing protein n=1 Tax=Rhizobium sp. G21 TaxID=2758439 RepID=UPI001602858D|nr:SPOR domain-containing protein [Rhizobium sp. G21]MBB1247965.1 SPOR domain-containing protein [Rhizobium sp. G21]